MRRFYPFFVSGQGAIGLLLVRLVMGLAFVLHGWPKIQNPFNWMEDLGLGHIPSFLQAIAAFAEFAGGIALILGLLTPIAALLLFFQMIGALVLVHFPQGDPFVRVDGSSYELPLLYLVLSLLFLLLGPGRLSLDDLWVKPSARQRVVIWPGQMGRR
jgi:putative oxidoreductase